MELLVTYDVATDTAAGRRRLRRVALVCQAYGQRVQKSVFECVLNSMQLQRLKDRLSAEIDPECDSLRFYRLREPHSKHLEIMGQRPQHDIRDPLVL
ncbi:MAG: CRISPR-associated endonuclease Cas2 [Chloroflexi bacterium]|nr:CRISPR-associated endonuclease Cas2 [Chloroflexota bacterium]